LKDRLNTPGFKSGNNGAPLVPRDVAVATILVWLWATNKDKFQQAFEKSGRIDVDPGCKWLIQAAVDTAVRALTLEIADSIARGEGPFSEPSASRKNQNVPKPANPPTMVEDAERANIARKVEIHTLMTINKALMSEVHIDEGANKAIPQFQSLAEYLDELRLCAFRSKCQERALLASLVARKATMTESFAHAYTSSVVRAGEAVGHGKLFEAVQDEETSVSSMMPYDIFTGEGDVWEDPCRPLSGFTSGLTGEELFRRAHARAMIQKSLRKLQDRNHIKGGTPSHGPYVDLSSCDSASGANSADGGVSPRPILRRKGTFLLEPPAPAGTGSAPAKSWSTYEPTHISIPLDWNPNYLENTPYGLYRFGERSRSLSLSVSSRSGEPRNIKKSKRSMIVTAPTVGFIQKADPDEKIPKSTREIIWADVAGIFQRVEVPKKSPTSKFGHGDKKPSKNIFAPYCRKIDSDPVYEDESDTEEDLSDETVLARHQVVLDEMKAKLSAFLEARNRVQNRRKSKASKS